MNALGGKDWCRQCEALKAPASVAACLSPFCKLKAAPPVAPLPVEPPPRVVNVHPAIIQQVERARAEPKKEKPMPEPKIKVSGKQIRLLAAMTKRAKPDGTVAVSFNDVFGEIGVSSPSCVSPLMKGLERAKLITLMHRPGGRSKTTYLIHGFAKKPPLGDPPAHIVGERTVEADELAPPPVIAEPETRIVAGVHVKIVAEECGSCRYGKARAIGVMICRRNPPTNLGQPRVQPADWCGEWKNGD